MDRLLRALASDDYAAREAARVRLAALAPAAREQLAARRDDPDPEIRRTVTLLLAALGEGEPPAASAESIGALGLVTFRASGPVGEVLARFAAEVGGSVTLPGDVASREVRVEVERVPFFAALDAVLEPVGLDVPYGFDDAGALSAGPRPEGGAPPAFAGPFRLDVTSAVGERTLRPASRRDLSLRLRLAWAPTVQVTTVHAPRIVRALDGAGAALVGVPMQTVYGVGGGRWTPIEVRFAPTASALTDRLDLVELTVEVRLRSEGQGVRFDDLTGDRLPAARSVPAPSGGAGETRVTLASFAADVERAGWGVADLVVSAAQGVPVESVAVVLDEDGAGAKVLADHASRIVAADGTLRLRVRTPVAPGSAGGRALRVLWYGREASVTVPFTLRDIPLR